MYPGYTGSDHQRRPLPPADPGSAARYGGAATHSAPTSPHLPQPHSAAGQHGYHLPPPGVSQPSPRVPPWPAKAVGYAVPGGVSASLPPHDPYAFPADRTLYTPSPEAVAANPVYASNPHANQYHTASRMSWNSSTSGDESGPRHATTDDIKSPIHSEAWLANPHTASSAGTHHPERNGHTWNSQVPVPMPARHSLPHVWSHAPEPRNSWSEDSATAQSSAYDGHPSGSRPTTAPGRQPYHPGDAPNHMNQAYASYTPSSEHTGFVWSAEPQSNEYGYRFPPHSQVPVPSYGSPVPSGLPGSSTGHASHGVPGTASTGAGPLGYSHPGYASQAPHAVGPTRSSISSVVSAGGRKKKRELQEVDAVCNVCGNVIAKLMLRGTWEEMRVEGGFETVHTCKQCRINQGYMPIGVIAKTTSNSSDSDADPPGGDLGPKRLRAKVAAAQGRKTPPPFGDVNVTKAPLRLKSTVATFRKRNRRTDDMTAPTICDCCLRELGAGGIVPRNGRSAIQFAVEIVCYHCLARYRRCTDCGGGGGARLGVGKWRAKELFADGRRTCALSHQRQGLPDEIDYYMWKVGDIPEEERDTIIGMIRAVLRHSLMSGLAIPEIMETGLAHISSFQDIENLINNGWINAERLLREDVERTKKRRRYVGLRWAKPHPRKGPRPPDPSELEALNSARPPTESVLRPGLELTGFIMAEWDLDKGCVFIPLVVPWQGDNFEATGSLNGHLLKRIVLDRMDITRSLVVEGHPHAEVERQYPVIEHTWTMMFFAREARPVHYLEKRRDFVPLDEYLEANPDASPAWFAPIRDCWIPVENQRGWQILARRQSERTSEDWEKRIQQAQKQAMGRQVGRRGMSNCAVGNAKGNDDRGDDVGGAVDSLH